MTVFVFTWNGTFLATPADTEDESLGAQRIRDTKSATGERIKVDHSLAGNAQDGKHTQVTLLARPTAAAVALDATDGQLFTSGVAGNTELFYQDSNGRVVQVTLAGVLDLPSAAPIIPSGTSMLFAQAAPPAGWTLESGVNDTLIRVNAVAGGGSGGAWGITGLSTQGHVLTVNELPPHAHDEFAGQGSGGGFAAWNIQTGNSFTGTGFQTGNTGGGAAHDHGPVLGDGTWRPPFFDVIVAFKN